MTDFTETLPRKRMAAGALITDADGQILIVKPTYRPDWLIPGGTVEADESPFQACAREVAEEVGIAIPIGRLLCVEYKPAFGPKTESLQFIFDGGVLSASAAQRIKLPAEELSEYRLCPPEEAARLLNPLQGQRVLTALRCRQQHRTIYLEDQREIGGPA